MNRTSAPRSKRPPGSARKAAIAATAAALVAASSVVAWRVLSPAEVVTAARRPYPAAPVIPMPGALGALTAAPLIVANRLRLFADERHVWTDTPPDFRYQQSPFWSYRRWPAQLVGVVVSENRPTDTGVPIVVTAWSDGTLVGIDAQTGQVIWEITAEPLAAGYTGRRTGASTVYQPPGLFTAGDLVIVAGPKNTSAYDPASGQPRWQVTPAASAECAGTGFTTDGQYLQLDTCAQVLRRYDTANGSTLPPLAEGVISASPLGCLVGHSDCEGVRVDDAGWLLTGQAPVRAEPLDSPDTVLAGPVAVGPAGAAAVTSLTAHDAATGEPRWTWTTTTDEPARVIAAGRDRVILLSESGKELIAVSAESGRELSRSAALLYFEPVQPIELGYVYTAGRYLAIERLHPGVPATAPDTEYFAYFRPILLLAT